MQALVQSLHRRRRHILSASEVQHDPVAISDEMVADSAGGIDILLPMTTVAEDSFAQPTEAKAFQSQTITFPRATGSR